MSASNAAARLRKFIAAAAGVLHQRNEELEFVGREADVLARGGFLAAEQIDAEFPDG